MDKKILIYALAQRQNKDIRADVDELVCLLVNPFTRNAIQRTPMLDRLPEVYDVEGLVLDYICKSTDYWDEMGKGEDGEIYRANSPTVEVAVEMLRDGFKEFEKFIAHNNNSGDEKIDWRNMQYDLKERIDRWGFRIRPRGCR